MSYRCGSDKYLEEIQTELLVEANRRLFHDVPDMPGFGHTYLEERLYLVKNLRSGVLFFAEGRNPKDAAEKVLVGYPVTIQNCGNLTINM